MQAAIVSLGMLQEDLEYLYGVFPRGHKGNMLWTCSMFLHCSHHQNGKVRSQTRRMFAPCCIFDMFLMLIWQDNAKLCPQIPNRENGASILGTWSIFSIYSAQRLWVKKVENIFNIHAVFSRCLQGEHGGKFLSIPAMFPTYFLWENGPLPPVLESDYRMIRVAVCSDLVSNPKIPNGG